MTIFTRVGVTLLTALALSASAKAADNACQSTIDQYLVDRAIKSSQIVRLVVVPLRRPGHDDDRVLGVEARIRLRTCRGSIILEMSQSCFLRQSYARGACKA